jgi:hypothetical protein
MYATDKLISLVWSCDTCAEVSILHSVLFRFIAAHLWRYSVFLHWPPSQSWQLWTVAALDVGHGSFPILSIGFPSDSHVHTRPIARRFLMTKELSYKRISCMLVGQLLSLEDQSSCIQAQTLSLSCVSLSVICILSWVQEPMMSTQYLYPILLKIHAWDACRMVQKYCIWTVHVSGFCGPHPCSRFDYPSCSRRSHLSVLPMQCMSHLSMVSLIGLFITLARHVHISWYQASLSWYLLHDITVKGYYFGGKRYSIVVGLTLPWWPFTHQAIYYWLPHPASLKSIISHMVTMHPFPSHSFTPTYSVYPHPENGLSLFVHVQGEATYYRTGKYPVFHAGSWSVVSIARYWMLLLLILTGVGEKTEPIFYQSPTCRNHYRSRSPSNGLIDPHIDFCSDISLQVP